MLVTSLHRRTAGVCLARLATWLANLAAAVTGVDDEKSNFEVSKQLTVQARGRKRRFEHELHEAEGKHATCKRQLLLAIDEDVQRGGKLNAI